VVLDSSIVDLSVATADLEILSPHAKIKITSLIELPEVRNLLCWL
jgi:hypothetical protein